MKPLSVQLLALASRHFLSEYYSVAPESEQRAVEGLISELNECLEGQNLARVLAVMCLGISAVERFSEEEEFLSALRQAKRND